MGIIELCREACPESCCCNGDDGRGRGAEASSLLGEPPRTIGVPPRAEDEPLGESARSGVISLVGLVLRAGGLSLDDLDLCVRDDSLGVTSIKLSRGGGRDVGCGLLGVVSSAVLVSRNLTRRGEPPRFSGSIAGEVFVLDDCVLTGDIDLADDIVPDLIPVTLPGLFANSLPLSCKLGRTTYFLLGPVLWSCEERSGDFSSLAVSAATFGPRVGSILNEERLLAIDGELVCFDIWEDWLGNLG